MFHFCELTRSALFPLLDGQLVTTVPRQDLAPLLVTAHALVEEFDLFWKNGKTTTSTTHSLSHITATSKTYKLPRTQPNAHAHPGAHAHTQMHRQNLSITARKKDRTNLKSRRLCATHNLYKASRAYLHFVQRSGVSWVKSETSNAFISPLQNLEHGIAMCKHTQ